ncbi:hypothetical protein Arcve_1922 [Archaeoglobus veneficus SNP6]|uniref:Uncharacterized protein n=1 Tax=Archaeoglobus veneficus (strain DSM 11195 / SNP6) TaxID=693661 RepID=F2KRQ1_ARCVS|nr:hypothetical protein Arcve_1922 [Archaeoglobus veneficus SNP6]
MNVSKVCLLISCLIYIISFFVGVFITAKMNSNAIVYLSS